MRLFLFLLVFLSCNTYQAQIELSPWEIEETGILYRKHDPSKLRVGTSFENQFGLKDLSVCALKVVKNSARSRWIGSFSTYGNSYLRYFKYDLGLDLTLSDRWALGVSVPCLLRTSFWDPSEHLIRGKLKLEYKLNNSNWVKLSLSTGVKEWREIGGIVHFTHQISNQLILMARAELLRTKVQCKGGIIYQIHDKVRMDAHLSSGTIPIGLGMNLKLYGLSLRFAASYHLYLGMKNTLMLWGEI